MTGLTCPETGEGRNRMKGCLNRSRAWLHAAALLVSFSFGLAVASNAAASVTIGQLPPGSPTANCTTTNEDYLQPSVTGGNLYVAKQAGTITSWTTDSFGPGAVYVVKVFRRTTDPDAFQVISHSSPHTLTSGINTVPASLHVESGDMLGYHESGPPNSCTFSQPGDNVIRRMGNLADGAFGTFAPENDVRLNLSAVLVPDNGFTLASTRDRKRGTATVTATTTNPGLVTISGKGMKKRASKSLAVAGPVTFPVATIGKTKHKLERKGRIGLTVRVTFFPTGGDATVQSINLKLRRTRPPTTS
jgi:hypothetical protein